MKQMRITKDVNSFLIDMKKKKGMNNKQFWQSVASAYKQMDAEIEDKNSVLTRNTLAKFYPQWMFSFLQNIKLGYLEEFGGTDHIPIVDEPYLILGAGPSLDKNMHLIKQFRGKILACDVILDKLLKHDIVPDYVMTLDGLPIVAKYFSTERVINRPRSISFVCATTAHPEVVNSWLKGKNPGFIYFYHPFLEDPNKTFSISGTMQLWAHKPVLLSGGNVGCTGWYLSFALKAAHSVMLGIDLAWWKEGMDDDYWKGKGKDVLDIRDLPLSKDFLEGNPKATIDELMALYKQVKNKFGYTVLTDYVKDAYKEANFSTMDQISKQQNFVTYQCSEYGILTPPVFDCMEFKDYLKGPHKEFWKSK